MKLVTLFRIVSAAGLCVSNCLYSYLSLGQVFFLNSCSMKSFMCFNKGTSHKHVIVLHTTLQRWVHSQVHGGSYRFGRGFMSERGTLQNSFRYTETATQGDSLEIKRKNK